MIAATEAVNFVCVDRVIKRRTDAGKTFQPSLTNLVIELFKPASKIEGNYYR